MVFNKTKLQDALILEPEKIQDARGFFATTWCQKDFAAHGLNVSLVQCNVSYNRAAGTLRGMHFQIAPFSQAKLVRCTRGAIYDVIIDLRTDSPTFKQWVAAELTESNHRLVYIPKGFAHGFQTLKDDSEVFYQMSEFYAPGYAQGVRWNDAAFDIEWPLGVTVISDRDNSYRDFDMALTEQ